MARTFQKEAGRSTKSKVVVPVPNAIGSQAPVNPDRAQSAGQSGTSSTELPDWLAVKQEIDRLLKEL
jgi:hypothetical protein